MTIKWYGLIVFPITLEKGGTKFPTMNNVVVCSDAGSGYKKTLRFFVMSNMFDKAGISVFCWYFNTPWEGKRSARDGHNKGVKSWQKYIMKGKYVPVCTTIELGFHTQSYNGIL